jgi:uncharacterized protein
MGTTVASIPVKRVDSGALLGQTMGLVALTAGLFALGAYLGRDMAGGLAILWFVGAFAALLAINAATPRSQEVATGLLFTFGLLLGLAVAHTIASYVGADPQAVWEAGGATALFTAGLGAAGYSTKRDLASIARYSLWALVGLIVFGIVLVFTQIPGGARIYSIAGLAIFAVLTLYDFQRLRQAAGDRAAPILVASIFVDIVNVFLLFLQIFGGEER